MKHFLKPLLIFLAVIGLFAYYYLAVVYDWWPFYCLDLEKKGQFGDSFGAFTSLFTALAFGGLLLTVWYQSKSLDEARKDNDRQHFENVLFRMLEIHNSILRDIDLRSKKTDQQTAIGRDCFYIYFVKQLKQVYEAVKKDNAGTAEREIALIAYDLFWKRQRHNLGHYFRYLYNVFKYIKKSDLSADDKKKYSNFVRAQLSDYELLILFYNCLSKNGVQYFKPMVEEFSIFNNLPQELLLHSSHADLYDKAAYQ